MSEAFLRRLSGTRPLAIVLDAADEDLGPERVSFGVVSGSLREVQQGLGQPADRDPAAVAALAGRLRAAGARTVCVLGLEGPGGRSIDWLDSEHARGWLASPSTAARTQPSDFAASLAAATVRGFVGADAAIVARMACSASGESADFIHDPALLPMLSWGEVPRFADPRPHASRDLGLYPIVDSADRLRQVLAAGAKTVQLRIKAPPQPDTPWRTMLRAEVQLSVAACLAADAELFVNDHWQLAAALGAHGVHLGQEDLIALTEEERSALLASGLALGVSSHSLWELCRAKALAPRYIACGPVWPTQTKDMPWRPQGLDNLSWWCRVAPAPVVAIGGVLGAQQVKEAARCGAAGVCIVRGLGEQPRQVVPLLQAALDAGRREFALHGAPRHWPHPSLVEEE